MLSGEASTRGPQADGGQNGDGDGDGDGDGGWVEVCTLDDILPDTGVCALVGGKQVAVFRIGAGEVYALQNFDPFGKAFVLSRGIVGDRGGVPKVASPIFKQSFNLRTGQCLDDPAVSLRAYPARVRSGRVQVRLVEVVEPVQAVQPVDARLDPPEG